MHSWNPQRVRGVVHLLQAIPMSYTYSTMALRKQCSVYFIALYIFSTVFSWLMLECYKLNLQIHWLLWNVLIDRKGPDETSRIIRICVFCVSAEILFCVTCSIDSISTLPFVCFSFVLIRTISTSKNLKIIYFYGIIGLKEQDILNILSAKFCKR